LLLVGVGKGREGRTDGVVVVLLVVVEEEGASI